MSDYSTLLLDFPAPFVARVRLNRPEVRNAFNEISIAELRRVFQSLHQADDVRVVLLAAEGKAFCAGADLNWMKKMADYSHAENIADAAELAGMLSDIYRCKHPVIACVQGDSYGGGMGLVSVADIVVTVPDAQFCLSEVKLGLIPATISPYVIKAMGEQAARRYFVTAERFDAAVAHRIGLAHEVVEADQLVATALALANNIVQNSPHAVRAAKKLVQHVAQQTIDAGLISDTVQQIADIRASDEGREGVRSFLEKRKAAWIRQ